MVGAPVASVSSAARTSADGVAQSPPAYPSPRRIQRIGGVELPQTSRCPFFNLLAPPLYFRARKISCRGYSLALNLPLAQAGTSSRIIPRASARPRRVHEIEMPTALAALRLIHRLESLRLPQTGKSIIARRADRPNKEIPESGQSVGKARPFS